MDAKLSRMIMSREGKTLVTSATFGRITNNYYGRRPALFSLYFRI